MATDGYAKLKKYTKSITVNGDNALVFDFDWITLGSGKYESNGCRRRRPRAYYM